MLELVGVAIAGLVFLTCLILFAYKWDKEHNEHDLP